MCALWLYPAHSLMGDPRSFVRQGCNSTERIHKPTIRYVFSIQHGPKACTKRTGATARVRGTRRRVSRRAMRASRSDMRAASQAFSRTHTHASIWRKHTLDDGAAGKNYCEGVLIVLNFSKQRKCAREQDWCCRAIPFRSRCCHSSQIQAT